MTREDIINNNIGLVYSVSKHFYSVAKQDLIQAGIIGLLKAYDNYIDNGTTKFSTYAKDYIYGEMYTLVNKNRPFKVSRDYLKAYKMLIKTKYLLAQRIGKEPTNLELANYLEKDVREIDNIMLSAESVMSLDSNNEDERDKYEMIRDNSISSLDDRIDVYDGLETLSDSEKKIIKARYFKDMTQSEVARKLNMTQVMVSRYEKKGIEKMRLYMTV